VSYYLVITLLSSGLGGGWTTYTHEIGELTDCEAAKATFHAAQSEAAYAYCKGRPPA